MQQRVRAGKSDLNKDIQQRIRAGKSDLNKDIQQSVGALIFALNMFRVGKFAVITGYAERAYPFGHVNLCNIRSLFNEAI